MKNKKINIKLILLSIFMIISANELIAENSIFELEAEKIEYIKNKNIIIANGKAYAKDQYGREIYADRIVYDKSNLKIFTKSNSKFLDKKKNIITADSFLYDLKSKLITAKTRVEYLEIKGNKFLFSEFRYDEIKETGNGHNVRAFLTDKSSFEGPYLELNNKTGIVVISKKKKSIESEKILLDTNRNYYTTCENKNNSKKNIAERCPDWRIETTKTTHDKSKKMITHENAVVKIKNIPIFYSPYFSHPDPTVDRKSGFLFPSTKNFSNLGRSFKIPYFWAVNNDIDLTFNPVILPDEHNIYHSTFRKQNFNSKLSLDTSYSKGYKNLNKKKKDGSSLNRTGGSRNHLFLNFYGEYDSLIFDKNDITINVQRISQKNYLKINQINNEFINQDISNLKNEIALNSYNENEKIKIYSTIYENLSIDDPNTKYQYLFPEIQYNNYFKRNDYLINLSNSFKAKNFDGDSKQSRQINNISIDSQKKIFNKTGIVSQIKTNLNNINIYNDKVSGQKQDLNTDLYPTIALSSTLPLWKINQLSDEKISSSVFTKYTLGNMNNIGQSTQIINKNDIFSMNRLNNETSPETGASIGYGIDYEKNKKNIKNQIFLKNSFFIGQVLNDKRKINMPESSSLNNKQSDFVGSASFYLDNTKKNAGSERTKNKLNLSYDFNISKNLEKIIKNEINIDYDYGKNSFSSKFYEINRTENTHYITSEYKRSFDNNINFLIGGKKNLEENFSENNFIEINYDSDCLKFGLNINKTFYQNEDLQSSNNITLFVMLKPFGQPFSPDLSSLID